MIFPELSKELNGCILFLEKYSSRICLVNYATCMGGMSIIRIIAADTKFMWEHELSNTPTNDTNGNNSLSYPDSIEGFLTNSWFNKRYTQSFKYWHVGTAHISMSHLLIRDHKVFIEDNIVTGLKRVKYLLDKYKGILLIPIHVDTIWLEKYFSNDIKIINLVGDKLPRDTTIAPSILECDIYKSGKSNFININPSNLLNKNYKIFIKEYVYLCYKLNLEYKGNSVRAFILLWLEKQERLING